MAGAPREKQVVDEVRSELKYRRAFFWKTAPGSYGTPAGMADFACSYRGLFVGLEVKRPNMKGNSELNPAQKRVHMAIRASGGFVEVVRSRDDARKVLDAIDKLIEDGTIVHNLPDPHGLGLTA